MKIESKEVMGLWVTKLTCTDIDCEVKKARTLKESQLKAMKYWLNIYWALRKEK